jgi:hypothetical protein
MAIKYRSIPVPAADVNSLRSSVDASKEVIETLTRQRGSPLNAAVTWQDLIDLKLIVPAQVPIKLGAQ